MNSSSILAILAAVGIVYYYQHSKDSAYGSATYNPLPSDPKIPIPKPAVVSGTVKPMTSNTAYAHYLNYKPTIKPQIMQPISKWKSTNNQFRYRFDHLPFNHP